MVGRTKTRWGIAIPQVFMEGPVDLSLIRKFVSRAEELEFHSLWALELKAADFPVLEPVGLLTYAAALTQRPYLGVAVLIAPLRSPVELAQTWATLDNVSGGRTIIGLGLGQVKETFSRYGVSEDRPVRRFLESVELMKALWTQETATFRGTFSQVLDLPMAPKPVQKPHPPIWFGSKHPDGLRRAVRHGDGWMGAGSTSTADFIQQAQLVREFLEQDGRHPEQFSMSKRVYIGIDEKRGRAEDRLQRWLGHVYKRKEMARTVAVYGSPAECVEGLTGVVQGGAELIVLNPVFDQLEQMERLAEEVIPQVTA